MSKIYKDNSLTIGNTPLVRLNRVSNGKVLAKIEARNPVSVLNVVSAPTWYGKQKKMAY